MFLAADIWLKGRLANMITHLLVHMDAMPVNELNPSTFDIYTSPRVPFTYSVWALQKKFDFSFVRYRNLGARSVEHRQIGVIQI